MARLVKTEKKEDYILLELKRQYGSDEVAKALFDEIAKLKFRIGELTSEVAELKHKPKPSKKKKDEQVLRINQLSKMVDRVSVERDAFQAKALQWERRCDNLLQRLNEKNGI